MFNQGGIYSFLFQFLLRFTKKNEQNRETDIQIEEVKEN
jgi:hypothetical protein